VSELTSKILKYRKRFANERETNIQIFQNKSLTKLLFLWKKSLGNKLGRIIMLKTSTKKVMIEVPPTK
jgi:hypothetical protein